jgi:hypothetical protein
MSRTIRIYNKSPIEGGPGFKGWVRTEVRKEILNDQKKSYNKSFRPNCEEDLGYPYLSFVPWITYHPYDSNLCCSHCKMCKDPTISKKRRLAYKRDLEYRKWQDGGLFKGLDNSSYEKYWKEDYYHDLISDFLEERDLVEGKEEWDEIYERWLEYQDSLNPDWDDCWGD